MTITSAVGLSDEHLIALGRITVNYSFMEFMLRSCLMLLGGADDKVTLALTSGLSFDALLSRVASVSEIRVAQGLRPAAEYEIEFDPLKNRIREAARKRNDVVHAVWEVGDTPGVITPRKIERRPKTDMLGEGKTPLTSMDLSSISEELLAVASELAAFYGAISLSVERSRRFGERAGPRGPA